MLRNRLWTPEPHDLVHADHALNSDTTQCPAQSCVLQSRVSSRYGHALPPNCAAVVTLRDLDCDPVPHDLVHVVHAVKLDTTQCTGQLCVLQGRVSLRYGHAYPPTVAGVTTDRERDWVPPVTDRRRRFLLPVFSAHECVHADHALKADTTQCPAQA